MNFFKPKFWDKNQVSFFSIILLPITLLIKLLSFFKYSITKTHKCSIPVICIGNIYLGGTGKTPLSMDVFSILKDLNMKPAFIRKKYDSFADEVNIQRKIGSVYQNKKRIKAIKDAIQNKANIVILDDGFQDYSIDKDLSIVCFNQKQWIGNGLTIPSGPLREGLGALKRANCVVINGNKNIQIEREIHNINKEIKIFYTTYKIKDIEKLKNKTVTAFAGIGNPENFFTLLKNNNINLNNEIKFPDHYNYSDKELEDLISEAKKSNTILLTTEKDHCRIKENYRKNINYLKILVEMENRDNFIHEVKKII
ncbi:MAG: tetraacyldisaccharide 4'-kinase [Pelagibacterales bacterium]|nr:tetraacyldisaccharide 4'-kinase [Pelagibacterales bacterium]